MSSAEIILSFLFEKIEEEPISKRIEVLKAYRAICANETLAKSIDDLVDSYRQVAKHQEQLQLTLRYG
ncbi:MAG: hypothetical protein AAGJ81_01510 [Verrucomicrobiota bacterium]